VQILWKRLASLTVVFLVVGCGKVQPAWQGKPASVASMEGFSETEKTRILDAIASFNEHIGKTAIETTFTEGTAPVFMQKVQAPAENPLRAGYAILESDQCTIQFSTMLFTKERESYLEPVVWHEFGHCAGLEHTATQGDIMSPESERMNQYPTAAIENFFSTIRGAIGL